MSEFSRRSSNSFDSDYGNPQFRSLVEEIWPHLASGQLADHRANDSQTTIPDPCQADGTGTAVSIGRFEIRRELGRGGDGVVLLAFDPRLQRTVAMKVPGPEGLLSSRSRQRFLSEARAVAALRHPNIVTIHEAGEAGPIPYLIMDYCEGGSLGDWLAARPTDRPVSPRWAARLVSQIADGLQHAHDQGILHRDLKPSNILFQRPAIDSSADLNRCFPGSDDEPDYQPMVTDFGLAKSLDDTKVGLEKTVDGLPLGTIPYMASEAARGDGAAIGFATDVYSLGVILYEILTGRRPFQAPSRAELLEQILNSEPPAPRLLRGDLPGDLEKICLRCLQKKAADRYQRPSDLARELRRFHDSLAESNSRRSVKEAMPPKSPGGWTHIRIALVSLVVVCVITLASAAIWRNRANQKSVIDGLFHQLESAELAALPGLVPKIDPSEPTTALRLARMFTEGTPNQRLAAALVLAKDGSESSNYCFEQLLQADPSDIAPIARLLQGRTTDLPTRLRRQIEAPRGQVSAPEVQDRRRANAACALIVLGQGNEGWTVLRFAPNPQARSFLIHDLGPAGVAPQKIVERLVQENDPSIRRSLIQSLGEISDADWPEGLRSRVGSLLSDLYENDSDPGVHGSCKWLLLRWNLDEEVRRLDDKLSHSSQPPNRRWRISPMGLTLVSVHDQTTGRDIEVADTEVTNELFTNFREDHSCTVSLNAGPSHPVSCMNYILAAEFCNWLSKQEGITTDEMAYRLGRELPLELVEEQPARTGYRLLTTREYELACRAGTRTTRYYGSTASLLSRYVWYGQSHELRMQPVARLKPNDFGLFDMLGNADEICQGLRANRSSREQAAVCGGSVLYDALSIRCDQNRGPISVTKDDLMSTAFGFRVARTIATPN